MPLWSLTAQGFGATGNTKPNWDLFFHRFTRSLSICLKYVFFGFVSILGVPAPRVGGNIKNHFGSGNTKENWELVFSVLFQIKQRGNGS